MAYRDIIRIDETKCDGCGLCVPACDEGAIQIIAGKARVVSEVYCDGLGACLGHCPRGAISIETREAAEFDPQAVEQHLAEQARLPISVQSTRGCLGTAPIRPGNSGPSSVRTTAQSDEIAQSSDGGKSMLVNWPVQLQLVQPEAPFLRESDLLIVADCVPFACADFHRKFLNGSPVVIGCPKLDQTQPYINKLADILRTAELQSITVVRMEVPCCGGLEQIIEAAKAKAAVEVDVKRVVVSRCGEMLSEDDLAKTVNSSTTSPLVPLAANR
jgi:NAD-dependent dihydropyrimidine dehydrogenase PreA subunit